jgi:hypothetical protein
MPLSTPGSMVPRGVLIEDLNSTRSPSFKSLKGTVAIEVPCPIVLYGDSASWMCASMQLSPRQLLGRVTSPQTAAQQGQPSRSRAATNVTTTPCDQIHCKLSTIRSVFCNRINSANTFRHVVRKNKNRTMQITRNYDK